MLLNIIIILVYTVFEKDYGVKAKRSDVKLKIFNNVQESILEYYYSLNTGSKFINFKTVRNSIDMDKNNMTNLINTLGQYASLDGQEYQKRLKDIIKYNNLDKYINLCDIH